MIHSSWELEIGVADDIIGRRKSCLGGISTGDDDLFVRDIGDVTGGKNTFLAGAAKGIDDNLVQLVQVQKASGQFTVGNRADLDKNTIGFDFNRLAGFAVFDQDLLDGLGAADLLDDMAKEHGDIGKMIQLVNQDLVRLEPVTTLDDRDMGGDAGQVDRGPNPGIAAAGDHDPLVFIKRPVTDGAIGDPVAGEFLLPGNIELPGQFPGCHDNRACFEDTAVLQDHFLDQAILDRFNHGIVFEIDAKLHDLVMELVSELDAVDIAIAQVIFDPRGIGHLATDLAGDQARRHALAQAVDCGSHAGRATPNDDHIIDFAGFESIEFRFTCKKAG